MDTLEKIRQIVKNEANEADWKYHIAIVVNYAKKLAKKLKVDEEIVELSALLHDIWRLRFGGKNHGNTGIPEAEKILKEYKYSQDIINEVTHCISSHSSKTTFPKTIIAQIIANADAMAHMDVLPVSIYLRAQKHSFEEVLTIVDEKIKHDREKKLTLPEAKKMMGKKYKAIRLLLDTNKKYM